jgi:hypothetical protein
MLEPRYDESIPEDKRFSTATPSGKLILQVNNPPVVDQLELGKVFYLDLIPVEKEGVL